VSKFIIT